MHKISKEKKSNNNTNNTNNLTKSSNDFDMSNIITFKNFREKNMKMLGLNCDKILKRKIFYVSKNYCI